MQIYNSIIIAERITFLCTQKYGVRQLTNLLKKCDIPKSTVDNMKRGSMVSADKLAVIADVLECSVDYLLGRTNTPEIGGVHQEITAGRDNYVNSTVNNGFSNDDIDLLHLIQNIPLIERSKLIFELSEKYSVER